MLNSHRSGSVVERGSHRGRPSGGFTLIELMITVAIVAILASVALPAYNNAVTKGRRAQGRTALLEAMQAQERWFTQNNTYLPVPTAGDPASPIKMTSGDNPTSPAYKMKAIQCPGSPAPAINSCVQLVAVPQRTDSDAGDLILLSTGAKDCSGTKRLVAGFCWP